jgi:hypothetical protein
VSTSDLVKAYEAKARGIPGLPATIVYLPDNPDALTLSAKLINGVGYIEGPAVYPVTQRIALHELGHLWHFNNRARQDAFWTARFGSCATAPKSWDEADHDAHPAPGMELWAVLPGESIAECFAIALAGSGRERTLDYGCVIDPAAMRTFFGVVDFQPAPGPVVRTTVVDYFSPHDRTFMDCIKANGASGIARYLTNSPTDQRQITRQEVSDAHAAGLAVHFFYEMNPTFAAYFTFAQGAEDCRQAIERLRELGAPNGTVVYFAVDANIDPLLVDPYMNGVDSMRTPQVIPGVYGFQRMIEHARSAYPEFGKHLAQTYGSPQGPLDLWQYQQEPRCGVSVDLNVATVAGWLPQKEDDMNKAEVIALIEETYGLTNTTQAIKDVLREQNAAIVKLANEETIDDVEVAALTARLDKLHTI